MVGDFVGDALGEGVWGIVVVVVVTVSPPCWSGLSGFVGGKLYPLPILFKLELQNVFSGSHAPLGTVQ